MIRLWSLTLFILVSLSRTNAEKETLVRFFEVTGGLHWINNTNWNTSAPICSWFGIACDQGTAADDNGVTSITLDANNLVGRVAKLIYAMPKLTTLSLKGNLLTDGGFEGFNATKVSPLTVLQLGDNALAHIKGIGHAPTSLVELHLSENRLKGPFPQEIFELENLQLLLLSFNALSGTIPSEIGKLTMLKKLFLFGNDFRGQIPSEIGKLTSVEIVTMAENNLHGTLPMEVNDLVALKTFSIHNNLDLQGQLTGPLRSFDKSPDLIELYLDGNDFSGTIPDNFLRAVDATSEVIKIGLSGNKLNGTLPEELSRFSSLYIDVTGNQIQAIPPELCKEISWMGGLVESFECDAILCPPGTYNSDGRQTSETMSCTTCDTGFIGSPYYGSKKCSETGEIHEWEIIPKFYVELRGVEWVNNSGWNILDTLLLTTKIEELNTTSLDYCQWFGITCNKQNMVEGIFLSNNGLTGQIPFLTFWLTKLKHLDLSRNAVFQDQFIGFASIARAASLEYLNLSGAKLVNLNKISLAPTLKHLYLDGIDLEKKDFPMEIIDLRKLETLHMQFSQLNGTIPTAIGALANLKELNLYNNALNGNIPTELGLLQNLVNLDISENAFVGTLPTELNSLGNMERFHAHQYFGELTGPLPAFAEFPNLIELTIDSNDFTGTIPDNFLKAVTNKTKHMKIGLSFNNLRGTVPKGLADFSDLDIQLEGNKFTLLSPTLCSKSKWMNGEVGLLGNRCDAILCPNNTWNLYGRASARAQVTCDPCPGNMYLGSTTCPLNITDKEKNILDKLYRETGGPYWKLADNWTISGVSICHREGVKCRNNSVDELLMNGMGLNGLIPSEIFDLPNLRLLGFTNNDVDMKFNNLANATKLETLKMSNTSIRSLLGIGSSPPTLTELHFANNQLTGTLPDELFRLGKVRIIVAEGNLFAGSIPSIIHGLTSIQNIILSNCDLTGQLPTELGQLTRLTKLDLSGNLISGPLPTQVAALSNLQFLLLGGQDGVNKMSGPLLDFKSNTELTELDLSGNKFQGTIPIEFLGGIDPNAAISVFLTDNQLSGSIPSNLISISKLYIDLSGNMINDISQVCDSKPLGWMKGKVSSLGCDALLCEPGYYLESGRQEIEGVGCMKCSAGSVAPFYGSTKCLSMQAKLERSSLIRMFQLLNGTNWNKNANWNSEKSVCTWFGIECDSTGYVTQISLAQNNLEATSANVSNFLSVLSSLTTLDLTGNLVALDLKNVPTSLQILKISATGLTSLEGLGVAQDLRRLHVTDNSLYGPIPDLIFDLTNLRALYLSFNSIAGTLPSKISNLKHLEEFYMYGNKMTGKLPNEPISSLTNLKEFIMAANFLSGPIPSSFSSLKKLEQLSLYGQQGASRLSGSIPNFLGAPKLWYFDVTSNDISGFIPIDFLANSIYKNGSVTMYLGENTLTGIVPASLDDFTDMDLLIVGNGISDIPKVLCDNPAWMQGDAGVVGTCAAIACLPGTYSTLGRQESVEKPCDTCTLAESASLWGQTSCGNVSPERKWLFTIYRNTGGVSWPYSTNWDSKKPICSWSGIRCSDGSADDDQGVTDIDLNNNNLVGTLPSEVFYFPSLTSLNVNGNADLKVTFTGLNQATNLELLYLTGTMLDNLNDISEASNLRELHLTDCGLTGPLPIELFDLSSTLEALYMNSNFFSGVLPTDIGRLTALKHFYALYNDFTGVIPTEVRYLKSLENMVLAENLISGSIPTQLSSLPNLEVLSIYRRTKPGPRLSGSLPAFDDVPKLTGLYLDGNDLHGTIPGRFLFASKSMMEVDLAHNRLGGNITKDIDAIAKLDIHLEDNEITGFPCEFYKIEDWMNGVIDSVGCDAFLCKPGTANIVGRANATLTCKQCDSGSGGKFYGSTSCGEAVDERSVLVNLYQKCGGRDWYRHDGWTTRDGMCTWFGITCNAMGSVESIDLGSNNLHGTFPRDIFDLRELKSLSLHSNPIDVNFDNIGSANRLINVRLDATNVKTLRNLGKARFLTVLDLRFTQLEGAFPSEILSLTNLRSLNMGYNKFSGPLPPSFANLPYLRILRLGSNKFSGALPSFDDLHVLDTLDLSNNDLTGKIPSNFLKRITTTANLEIDLAGNQLTGIVPVELDRFYTVTFHLRENYIVGLPNNFCGNAEWNSGDVESFGCDGILCPPGTYNNWGRARGPTLCLQCLDEVPYYGRVECKAPSTASRLATWSLGTIVFLVSLTWM